MSYDLADLTPRDSRCWHEGYTWGYVHGVEEGRRQADTEAAEHWRGVAEYVQRLGSPQSVPYSVLAERRGETDRAERARADERRVMAS